MATNVIIPDIIGGVSQLPPDQRAENQLEVLDNALPSRPLGLRKRPPAVQIGQLKADQVGWDDAFVYAVNRTPTERYVVVIANGDLKVFDALTGAPQTVTFPDGKGYLPNSVNGFRAVTVGDHTFIANRDITVRRGNTVSPKPSNDALIFVRMTDYSTVYGLKVDDSPFYFSSQTGPAGSGQEMTTEWVAASLMDKMLHSTYSAQFLAQFSVELLGSSIYIKRIDGKPFTLSHYDGLADKGLSVIAGSVQALTDLPERAKVGMLVEVKGDPGSTNDNLWVTYEEGVGDGTGVWRETTAPAISVDFDNTTMPHELVRTGTYGPPLTMPDLKQPTYTSISDNAPFTYGYTLDETDTALSGAATDNHIVETYNGAARTALAGITGDPTLSRVVTFGFDVDTGTMYYGAPCNVVFSAKLAGVWTELGRRYYAAGQHLKNQTWSAVGVFPTGTRFEAKLAYAAIVINPLVPSRRARLTMHGSGDPIPGLVVAKVPYVRFSIGNPATYWPMGSVFTVTVDGTPFTYTLPDDMTGAAVAAAMAAVINGGSWVASYSGPSHFGGNGGNGDASPPAPLANRGSYVNGVWGPGGVFFVYSAGLIVQKSTGALPATISCSMTIDAAHYIWDPTATLTPAALVGLVLRNFSDGSSGTILANSVRCIKVNSLTGGYDNTFELGDGGSVIDTGASTWVFRHIDWDYRLVGNDDLAPYPGFVDREIGEVFFYAGRLGFTAEDRVTLSAAGDIHRFWRETVTQVLDTDPIDIINANQAAGFLDSAVEWQGKLLICSSSGHQYNLTGNPTLTPATVQLEHLSSYPQGDKCRPVTAGNSLYIASSQAGFSRLRELYVTRDGIMSDACTDHVPRYVPGDPLGLCGDADLGMVAVRCSGDRNSVFVFCYSPLNDQNRQKAWARWTFGGRVLGIDFSSGYLYVVRYRSGGVYLDTIAVGNPPDPTALHQDAGTGAYTFTARLSRVFIADRNGNPVLSGRTQVHTVRPVLDAGDCTVSVTPANRAAKSYVLGPRRLRAPILAENGAVTIDLVNSGTTGLSLTGLEYEVSMTNRSR